MKRQFFDTGFATYAGLSAQTPRVLRYAVENRDRIIPVEELGSMSRSIRSILKTPMAELFDRIVSTGGLSNFAAIYVSPKETSVPELLTSSSITLDLKQCSDSNIIRGIPELKDKILVNLSGVLRPNRDEGYQVNAVDIFQNLFVRGHLVASYQDADDWLTPYLSEYGVKTYSMILSGLISKFYNLSLTETLKVAGIFALWMSQMLSREQDGLHCPPLFMKATYVGTRGELMELANVIKDMYPDGLNIFNACDCVSKLITERVRNFNVAALGAMTGNLGPDQITSRIALEYPPYWIYMLIMALSGAKLPLIYQLQAQRLVADGRTKFLQQFLTTERLYAVDRR